MSEQKEKLAEPIAKALKESFGVDLTNMNEDMVKNKEKGRELYNDNKNFIEDENNAIKKDMEKNPKKYIDKLSERIKVLDKRLALKAVSFRSFEKMSLQTVSELQKEISEKDSEIQRLKDVVNQIKFVADTVFDPNNG